MLIVWRSEKPGLMLIVWRSEKPGLMLILEAAGISSRNSFIKMNLKEYYPQSQRGRHSAQGSGEKVSVDLIDTLHQIYITTAATYQHQDTWSRQIIVTISPYPSPECPTSTAEAAPTRCNSSSPIRGVTRTEASLMILELYLRALIAA